MRYPDDVPVLTDNGAAGDAGDAVTLRPLGLADVPRVVEQCTDPDSVEWTTVPQPYDEAEARTWITEVVPAGWERGADLTFAIEERGVFAGSVSLRPWASGEAEVGFGLHPDARGRGVMLRAMNLLIDWAAAERGVAVVHWRANVGNWASRRVAWAAGFTFGPTIPRLLDHRGERRDGWTGWLHTDGPRRPASSWGEAPVLVGDGVRLRPWREADAPQLVEAGNDEGIRHYGPQNRLPRDLASVPAYLARIGTAVADRELVAWAVTDPETDVALGGVSLFDLNGPEGQQQSELGYWVLPGARRRGVGSAALRRAAGWALAADGFGLRRLYLLIAVGNTASRRTAEAAGFTLAGQERGAAVTAAGFEDNALYDRLIDDAVPDDAVPDLPGPAA